MALTLEEQKDFLNSEEEKIILCDIEFHDGTQYQLGTFSNYPYILGADNVFYWQFPDQTYRNEDLGITVAYSNATALYSGGDKSWSDNELVGDYLYNVDLGEYATIVSNNSGIFIDTDYNMQAAGWVSNTHHIIITPGTIIENRVYDDILIGVPNITHKIDSDVSFGSLEFLNPSGTYDDYIRYAWEGHSIAIYIGSPTWGKQDFIPVTRAISTNITSPRPNVLALQLFDKKGVFDVKAQTLQITHEYLYDLYNMERDIDIKTITISGTDYLITFNDGIGGTLSIPDIKFLKLQGREFADDIWLPTTNFDTTTAQIDTTILTTSQLSELGSLVVGDTMDMFRDSEGLYLFNQPVNNLNQVTNAIEIPINSNSTKEEIAAITKSYINSLPALTAELGTTVHASNPDHRIIITGIQYGNAQDSLDYGGVTSFIANATGFSINAAIESDTFGSYASPTITLGTSTITDTLYNGGMVYNETRDEWADILSNTATQVTLTTADSGIPNAAPTWQATDVLKFYQHRDGDSTSSEIISIQTVDDVTGSLNNTFFTLNTPGSLYYFWYNVDGGGKDPGFVDFTQESFNPTVHVIPDTVLNTPVCLCLGKCFNIQPKLIDASNHVYQVHEGKIQNITDIRTNGVSLDSSQYELNLNKGLFRLLTHENNTQITCDVVGAKTRGTGFDNSYTIAKYTAPWLVEWLALEKTSLTSNDLCSGTFPTNPLLPQAFLNPSNLGLFLDSEVDIAPIITEIMTSVGGFARFGKVCSISESDTSSIRLQILELEEPDIKAQRLIAAGSNIYNITEDDIFEDGISLSSTEPPKHTITLGYNKNWNPQEKGTLAGLLSDTSQDFLHLLDLYTNEFSKVYATKDDVLISYPLAEDTEVLETLIYDEINTTYAQTEVNKRSNIRRKKRFVFNIKTNNVSINLGVGDVVKLTHPRFGFKHGKYVFIIGILENPLDNTVDLEVWL